MATSISVDEETPLVSARGEATTTATSASASAGPSDSDEEDYDGCFELGRRERIYVGCAWIGLSLLCQALGWVSFHTGRSSAFAILTFLSALFTLVATCVFSGCRSTLSNVLGADRRCAFLFMLSCAVLLFLAGYYHLGDITIAYVAGLYVAAQMWFSLSYIPGGRTAAKALFRQVLNCCHYLTR